MLENRFTVSSALAFSNRGGVYRGSDDRSGRAVVAKEARPLVELGRDRQEAVAVLEKEYRILGKLVDTGLFVRPVGLCRVWEHTFLVEEHVSGESLGRYIIRHHPLYAGGIDTRSVHAYLRRTRALWVQLARAIEGAHARGITLGDLSFTNVLIHDHTIRICDLETATEAGVDTPIGLHTPGMAASGVDGRADDYRALGMLMFGSLVLAHGVAAYHTPARRRFIAELRIDLALPDPLLELVDDLVERPARAVADPKHVVRALAAVSVEVRPSRVRTPRLSDDRRRRYTTHEQQAMRDRARLTVAGVADYLRGTADVERDDRLFPADPMVFETNPMSVAYGAAGVLHAMHHLEGDVPPSLSRWFVQRLDDGPERPPGLYSGESGIAWTLHELGYPALAAERLLAAGERVDAGVCADLLHGAAGHGMACLALWSRGAGERFLRAARNVGQHLRTTCASDEHGTFWPDASGTVRTGYARGGSGIALFLLYLALASREREHLALGRTALAHELAQGVWLDGRFAGFPELATRAGEPAPEARVLGCYWEFGSAGIGSCVARYYALRKEPELRTWLYRLAEDCARKYTAYPQLFRGLAGLGNFLIDAWRHTGDERLRIAAWEAAEGVSLFRIDSDEGIGFPGEQLRRESADLATGAAGVGLFLNRLSRSDEAPQPDFNFVVDELLDLGPP